MEFLGTCPLNHQYLRTPAHCWLQYHKCCAPIGTGPDAQIILGGRTTQKIIIFFNAIVRLNIRAALCCKFAACYLMKETAVL